VVAFGGRRGTANPVAPHEDSADEGRGEAAESSGEDPESASGRADEDPADDDGVSEDDDDGDADDPTGAGELIEQHDAGKKHKRAHGGCPSRMARVRDVCVDRYEAPNRRGARPLVMQSANDAVAWCTAHGKRLCTEDEWITTCEGDDHRAYPYGNEHVESRCNDDKAWRTVDEATLAKWPAPEAHAHARELYQATPSGSKHKCASDTGVGDLTGNVEEWVVRTRQHANDWPYLLIGCYWSGCFGGGKPTCHSTNDAHGPEFRFYETGFRCCRDAAKKKEPENP
jgi:formylglycine-generating enzyme required for sulfatase activity